MAIGVESPGTRYRCLKWCFCNFSILDPDHFRVHTLLARLYEQEGEIDTAMVGYRMGIASGGEGFLPRYRLARLYFKKRRWQGSCKIFWHALKELPKDVNETAAGITIE